MGGRAVLPGWVDSHSHAVFAGDRSAEFTARMAGHPYTAGGMQVTVAATRAASDDELAATARALRAEMARGGTTTAETKTGYGLTIADEVRLARSAAVASFDEITFLGAHVVPPEFADNTDGYVDLVCGDMLAAVRPLVRWIDVFCESGAFDEPASRRVLRAGAAAGLGLRVHGNQLGPGPGVRLAVELGAASVDHCTHLDAADLAALSGSSTVATLLPLCDLSTRQPPAPGRALADAGARVAVASNCNPGSSYSSSMSLSAALAVLQCRLTADEAVHAGTAGGAAALRRTDVGTIRPGARADLHVLDAPSHEYLAYRPGVALTHAVFAGGERIV
jgi:imidazolonepropionase